MPADSSRSQRIFILLIIDSAFFFLELIVGYSVGSLALVADSFHMLNDVCSLLVALYAIKLARDSKRSHEYSYGWQRAEVLGALINGVFLLALCFSIFLEAIQRVFAPVDIKSPPLVVIVGSLGLASNIVGLLLFHEHGHSHGHSHSHSHSKPAQITPPHAHHHLPIVIENHPPEPNPANEHTHLLVSSSAPDSSQLARQSSATSFQSYDSSPDQDPSLARKTNSLLDEICVHPAQTRNNILRAAELKRDQLNHHQHKSHHTGASVPQPPGATAPTDPGALDVEAHVHSHSHSHSHMNMRAIFLHALGDALGNVGVIMTGLLIWLVPRFDKHGNSLGNHWVLYADPAISLIITVIIFTSALPLVRSASLILLQGTPPNVDLGRVQTSIQAIQGVLQVHELHIWSLSESKLVASVHVLIRSQADFVSISRHIRKCLHQYGIHSSTIQPEILMEEQLNNIRAKSMVSNSRSSSAQSVADPTSVGVTQTLIDADGCLVQCDETCDEEACCPPGIIASSAVGEDPSVSSVTG